MKAGTPTDFVLAVTPERLELRETAAGAPGPIYSEFITGRMGYRLATVSRTKQLLAKAVGARKGVALIALDATCGLGQDAMILAALGCSVVAVERSPVLFALVRDGLRRAQEAGLPHSFELLLADSRELLHQLLLGKVAAPLALCRNSGHAVPADGRPDKAATFKPDVICLDPMFPARSKFARAKKEMTLARMVSGNDEDAAELLALASQVAARRVVVKRPLKSPPLSQGPSFSIKGRSIRFDVYLLP
jgi:16S rRNA (guanine1516-N2)-methyltransferase